jgi:hypothetical protein
MQERYMPSKKNCPLTNTDGVLAVEGELDKEEKA